jgi:hypothetical protein
MKSARNYNMARNNYFNRGDLFSEFHRSIQDDTFKFLDLDAIFYNHCKRCNNKQILFIAETAYFKGNLFKSTDITRLMAKMMGVPAYLIFYHPVNANIKTTDAQIKELGYDPNLRLKVAKIDHLKSNYGYEFKDYTAYEWVIFEKEQRMLHKCNSLECIKWQK